MLKVVSLMRLGDVENELEENFDNVTFKFYKHPAVLDEADKEDMDILISYHEAVDETFINECPNLKWIAWFATGVNSLPMDVLKEKDIQLTNAKGVHKRQLSEFILAYILDDYKLMKASYENQTKHVYDHKMQPTLVDGERVLFLGTGTIPKHTAKILNVLGMHTIGLNTDGHSVEGFEETYSIEERHHIYHKADIIVNVLPETNETIHLLKSDDFKAMNDHTLFINVGRGTIVETQVLIDALESKEIRKAYVDVFENEPLNEDSPLFETQNLFLTAHITGNGTHNKTEAAHIFATNLKHFLNKDGLIENVVDLNKGY
ncbi:phosphoglycerate dehydrogenase [Staphylococcus massiliensis]|uniref:Phosphoglycerate dehydrogenase-like protein n=1 Tax=Staphylococcus massiliensis S46 TaxID=1229783 RepID=K9AUT7_9STAP|nr:phosphoglycerate dehydrogenase [Staphylococcus massiliensis]EKU45240.1 phosphoglycerate dehydrogenase-like protein [Staphylococcus massiliensis S46]MCG3400701.1 phosphoglycerate dehydrogenase [Staphylococcus massiliensis]MCG3402695.1 phosphoglycerate dehydrogenase [Staphylococcus massiliensis]MCG3413610.1 phosphoglycerate dehydrogenase [Staphylococcus massiliensis]PNZ97197.1 hydroxyacid dehydrogenase [Staphylococcus massiliensis CCUG 55927]